MKNNQKGRSMIEMLGVLAIIGVLSVGGIAGYSKAMTKYRTNKAIEQITLIAGNIRTFFKGDYEEAKCQCWDNNCYDNYGGGDSIANGCPIIKKAKILPDEMVTLDATGKMIAITGTFGDYVGIYRVGRGFGIDYSIGRNNMEACLELVTYDWQSVGVTYISGYTYEGHDLTAKLPVSMDNAIKICTIDDEAYEILFTFDAKECLGCIFVD